VPGGAVTLRCLDVAGCDLTPWGWRAYGETYTLPGDLARALTAQRPERFAIASGEYNLQAVRGIGPEIERALQALGVLTLADLVRADPGELDAHLDGTDLDTVMAWQVQAVSMLQEAINGQQL
jgi:hypothetical protein